MGYIDSLYHFSDTIELGYFFIDEYIRMKWENNKSSRSK